MEESLTPQQRYYLKNKNVVKQRVYSQREAKKQQLTIDDDAIRTHFILTFYKTIQTDYFFMIWARNIKRVNKEFISLVVA